MLDPPPPVGDTADLVRRAIAGDPTAAAEVIAAAPVSEDPALLVVATMVSGEPDHVGRAGRYARSARDRQLVALADAHVGGDLDLFDALVREHLAEYPDHVLAAWLAAEPRRRTPPLTIDEPQERKS